MTFARLTFLLMTLSAWSGSVARATDDQPPADAAQVEFFEKQVRPLLVERCHSCHGPDEQKGSLRLDSQAAAMAGGDLGPAIVPGKPEESLLIEAIRRGEILQMPPRNKLPDAEVEILTRWVEQGAHWPGLEPATFRFNLSTTSFQYRGARSTLVVPAFETG